MADTGDDYLARLVDDDALRAYLAEHLGPADEMTIHRHDEGHSNETLFVTWGDRELVIRRPPPGETADSAHDVLREHRVLSALQDGEVPVPPTVLACDDPDVIGGEFFVMERVEGDVVRADEPERFANPEARRRIGEEAVAGLARIHGVDYESVGLDDFGYPEGFTGRQVERWGDQLAWAFEVTEAERAVPGLERVGEWLEANCPDEYPHTLVHGDYKLDNLMFAPGTPPELVSVFDWELSTLGDPGTDLGWLLLFWHDADDPDPAVPELQPAFTAREGYPTRRDLLERYEALTGRDFEHARFYRALAAYKLAALGEMFFRRHLEGNSDDPLYPLMEDRVPALADHAERVVDGEAPL